VANKLKLALYRSAGCGGCDVALFDSDGGILDIADIADIVFWPMVLDFKYQHVEAMADKAIDVCLFSGAIGSPEEERMARLLRARSKMMVAFGSCACFGGIPALANLTTRSEILERAYIEIPSNSNPDRTLPQPLTRVSEGELELTEPYDTVSTLNQVVDTEYFVPGCPPPADLILKALHACAAGQLPPAGSVFASDKALCSECERVREGKKITRVYRSHQTTPDPQRCFLEQGLICLGPATRGGCGQTCIKANTPCRGCFGPPPGVVDQGAKMLSAVASIYTVKEEAEMAAMADEVVDPAATFYRFGMASAMLKRKRTR